MTTDCRFTDPAIARARSSKQAVSRKQSSCECGMAPMGFRSYVMAALTLPSKNYVSPVSELISGISNVLVLCCICVKWCQWDDS